jgi:beta-glucanase (GH16 family)
MSARITTKQSHHIQFGKVEIRAKLPRGDWLWPALWMLPVDNAYGIWPQSGEIDIMESRGNGPEYKAQYVSVPIFSASSF